MGRSGEGNSRDTSHHRTQEEAIGAARDIARNQGAAFLIHGRDCTSATRTRTATIPTRRAIDATELSLTQMIVQNPSPTRLS